MSDDETLRKLDVDDLIALITALRRDCAAATTAADAGAEAVGNMAEKLSSTLAENTRLQHLVADIFTALYPPEPADLASVSPANAIECTELPTRVATMRSERDRLRAVVDVVWVMVEEAGPWPAVDLGTEQYNRLMAALTQLDYHDGDWAKTGEDT